MIRRINFFGGPGVGKSTLASRVFTMWSQLGHSVAQVPEIVKQLVYARTPPQGWDYTLTFAQQLHSEYTPLNYGVQRIVTDSPLLLQCIYAAHHKCPVTNALSRICDKFEEQFPSINFLVERHFPFQSEGRFQADEAEALHMDRIIEDLMGCYCIPYTRINPNVSDMNLENIMDAIECQD
jgi:hypothetical protein